MYKGVLEARSWETMVMVRGIRRERGRVKEWRRRKERGRV